MSTTAAEKTAPTLPENITLNGVTYSVRETPELQEFIQSVAKVEKSKLYSQFESLKSQFNQLSKVQVEQPNAPTDIAQMKQEITQSIVSELLPQLKNVVTEIVQPVLAATEATQRETLDKYREEIISQNLATCIPDLVKGSTKEELDASLMESIRIRAAYPSANALPVTGRVTDPLVAKQLAESEQQLRGVQPVAQVPATQTVPRVPAVPSIPAPDASQQPSQVKSMSMEEFARQRESLLQGLTSVLEG